MAIEEKKFLGTAGVQQLITNTRNEISAAEQAAKKYADDLADNYDAAGTAQTKVNELAQGQVKTNTEHIGTMDNLETTAKNDLVNAINEVRNAVSAGGTAAAITMTEQTSNLGDGIAKAYVLKQGDNTVGTINIPKDMVVQSGEVVVNPEGQAAGTYIKLTLANATNDVIYVNVGTLVDIYKAKANATQVQLAIDSSSREISATIVAGSVTDTELAANAVVTAKIADGNVTKAKLSTEVQASLDKADAAYTTEEVDHLVEGVENQIYNLENNTIEPMGADVEALKTFKNEIAQAVETNADNIGMTTDRVAAVETSLATGGATANAIADAKKAGTDASAHADDLNTAMNTRVEALEAIGHDHSNKTQLASYDKTQSELLAAAQSAAESYADSKVAGVDLSGIATNAADIDKLEASLAEGGATASAIAEAKKAGTDAAGVASSNAGRIDVLESAVEALESVTYVEITAAEIDAMFAS